MKILHWGLAAGLCALAVPVLAEKLQVHGIYPALSDEAAAVRSVAVEPFGGDFGPDLAIRIEDVLREASLQGRPWLRVVPSGAGSGVDAVLRGTADAEQRITGYTEERERCVKDAGGNCTPAKEKYTVQCKRRHIELVVMIRLIATDGRLLWADDRPLSADDSWCEDRTGSQRTLSAVARGLAAQAAERMRAEFVPFEMDQEVRVDENRKGLSAADGNLFKAAVKKVKQKDAGGACSDWKALLATNPNHVPTIYNLGLCAESAGDDVGAEGFYRQAVRLDPRNDKSQDGLNRIAQRNRARRQIEAHEAG